MNILRQNLKVDLFQWSQERRKPAEFLNTYLLWVCFWKMECVYLNNCEILKWDKLLQLWLQYSWDSLALSPWGSWLFARNVGFLIFFLCSCTNLRILNASVGWLEWLFVNMFIWYMQNFKLNLHLSQTWLSIQRRITLTFRKYWIMYLMQSELVLGSWQ